MKEYEFMVVPKDLISNKPSLRVNKFDRIINTEKLVACIYYDAFYEKIRYIYEMALVKDNKFESIGSIGVGCRGLVL